MSSKLNPHISQSWTFTLADFYRKRFSVLPNIVVFPRGAIMGAIWGSHWGANMGFIRGAIWGGPDFVYTRLKAFFKTVTIEQLINEIVP